MVISCTQKVQNDGPDWIAQSGIRGAGAPAGPITPLTDLKFFGWCESDTVVSGTRRE
jgi:hypothetical protein